MKQKVRKSTELKFVKDIGKTTVAKIISVVFGFVLKIFIVRFLTKEDFGLIAVLTSLNVYFGMMADFSTHSITQRNIIKDKDNYTLHYHIYANVKVITTVISTLLFIITAYFLGYFDYTLIMIILIINMVFSTLSTVPKILIESFEKFWLYSKIMIMIALVNTVVQAAIIYHYQTVEALVIAILIVSIINLILYFEGVGKYYKAVYRVKIVKWYEIKNLIRESFPLFAGSFIYLLYYRIDTIMVEKIAGMEAAAEYNLGFSMADQILEILWVQFIIVFYPKMIKMYHEDKVLLGKRLKLISCILAVLYGSVFLFSNVYGELIFGLVFGAQYEYSGFIFSWTIVAMFFTSIFALYYRILIITDRQKFYLYLMILGGVLNFVLNVYYINEYGNIGAVITTIIVNIIIVLFVIAEGTKLLKG